MHNIYSRSCWNFPPPPLSKHKFIPKDLPPPTLCSTTTNKKEMCRKPHPGIFLKGNPSKIHPNPSNVESPQNPSKSWIIPPTKKQWPKTQTNTIPNSQFPTTSFLGGKTAAFLVPIITAALKAGRKPAKELDGTGCCWSYRKHRGIFWV